MESFSCIENKKKILVTRGKQYYLVILINNISRYFLFDNLVKFEYTNTNPLKDSRSKWINRRWKNEIKGYNYIHGGRFGGCVCVFDVASAASFSAAIVVS